MEFKMERKGLLEPGQRITVTEGLLPSNYYYVIDPALAMSANIPFRNRLKSREGIVVDVVENARGFYVTAQFDEPEIEGRNPAWESDNAWKSGGIGSEELRKAA